MSYFGMWVLFWCALAYGPSVFIVAGIVLGTAYGVFARLARGMVMETGER